MQRKNYKIEIPHFYCLEYYEGDKKITIEIDFRDPIHLNISLIKKWDFPNDKENISIEKKVEILRNIYAYLTDSGETEDVKLEIKVLKQNSSYSNCYYSS